MSEIQDSVSKTALTMAAKRAIENQRSDRLFADPFAEKLAADAILQDTPSKCHRQAIVADFRETWSNLLVDRGYRVDFPSIWLDVLSSLLPKKLVKTINSLSF